MRSRAPGAFETVLFLLLLLQTYPHQPILLFLDRAPWHKRKALRSLPAAHPRLEIAWFPPGCPELNPQEHVWKAARKAVSHNHRWAKMTELAGAIRDGRAYLKAVLEYDIAETRPNVRFKVVTGARILAREQGDVGEAQLRHERSLRKAWNGHAILRTGSGMPLIRSIWVWWLGRRAI